MQLGSELGHSFNTTPGYPQFCLSHLLLSCLYITRDPPEVQTYTLYSPHAFSEYASGSGHVCCTLTSSVCMVAFLSYYSFKKFLPQSLPSYDIGPVCCLPLLPSPILVGYEKYMSLNLSTVEVTASKATWAQGCRDTKQRSASVLVPQGQIGQNT